MEKSGESRIRKYVMNSVVNWGEAKLVVAVNVLSGELVVFQKCASVKNFFSSTL